MAQKYFFSIVANPDEVIADGKKIKFIRKSDLTSYKEFIKYFRDLTDIKEHNLVIGINFTYGWMPTIFEFTSNEISSAVSLLNSARSGNMLTSEELNVLKNLFNNSLVGSSKLLHVINPEKYAIWDSRVFSYLTKKKPYENQIGNPESYLTYLKWINSVIQLKRYHELKCDIQKNVGYDMSDYRIVELVMYSQGNPRRVQNGAQKI